MNLQQKLDRALQEVNRIFSELDNAGYEIEGTFEPRARVEVTNFSSAIPEYRTHHAPRIVMHEIYKKRPFKGDI
jgi:hypothetical protein